MKFLSILSLGMIATAVDAAYPNPGNGPADACYTAVAKPNNKQRTSDCKSFLLTTVTPKKSTIYKTTTITRKTPTVTKSITVTSTLSAIATSISSVVQTVTDNIVVTRTVDHTKTVTEQTTTTITTDVADPAPTVKRKRSVSRIPEYLDNLCTNSAQYSSACSRIGVTAKTVSGPRVTVVSKIVRVKIPRATTVRTTVSTTWVTQTVKTTVVLKTYSTEEVTKTVDVVTDDVTVATKTVTETTTKTEASNPLETVKLLAVGSNDPVLQGIGFSNLESNQGSSSSFYMTFTSVLSNQQYTIHKVTGEVKALNGPGNAAGQFGSYNFSPGSGNPYGPAMIQAKGGVPPLKMPKNRPSQQKRNEAKHEEWAKERRERELHEHETAKAVADNDKLEFGAKIDELAKIRKWFSGDTPILDQYLGGSLTLAETVDTIAKPIDVSYSSADFGRKYYEEEMCARTQRGFHSPEKAIELWGPEEDYPEPREEWDPLKSTESQLWVLWFSILHAAKRITFTDEAQQQKLVDLVKAFKERPNPPPPEPMTIPLKRSWIWESGTLWTDLTVLGISVSETFNDVCGCGAGWLWPEQRACENLYAFMARLTSEGINLARIGLSCVNALEQTPFPGYRTFPAPPISEVLSYDVTCAALWTIIAGKEVYSVYSDTRDERDIQVVDRIIGLRDNKLPWKRSLNKYKGRARWETARKEFARRRFEEESRNEELSAEVRELAAKAAQAMIPLIWLQGQKTDKE
ncbi:hypothetical protein FPSE_03287 [Fusarium pseudograminearum CS3096]|uniref:Uncharacterized protein n=1 Tax=Fusarium pseudograminearum (strain CS3096) TaxID=1028729 RepID=K3VN30_FUSPC|nr:hypothetical protein FPSE_03287 [Fusarium pseudograminearum CS3096]EKJ76527.1 hypothetical protein FPSE_03287 [Fusarium pseudograminearum CS3096]